MTVPKMKIVCLKQASVRGTMDLNLRTGVFLYGKAGEPQYPQYQRPCPALPPLLPQVPQDHGVRPVLRGADDRLRAGAAADCPHDYDPRDLRRRVADGAVRADDGRCLHAVAHHRRGGKLLHAVHRAYHGQPAGNGYAPRHLPPPAGAVLRLLLGHESRADHGAHHVRPV